MKNLFVGLLMFAGTLFAVANNSEGDKRIKGQENVIVTLEENKVINNLDDDTCSITITTTTTVTDNNSTTVHVSSSTGTGTTCAEAEADARSTN